MDNFENFTVKQLIDYSNQINWDNEPSYNRPDWNKDSLAVIKAKLSTVWKRDEESWKKGKKNTSQ